MASLIYTSFTVLAVSVENQEIVKLMRKLGMVFTRPPKNLTVEDIGGTKTMRLNEIPDPSGRDIYLHFDRESNETYNKICSLISNERHAEHNSPRDIERAIIQFIREIITDPERFRDLGQLKLKVEQMLSTLLKTFEPVSAKKAEYTITDNMVVITVEGKN